MKAPETFQDLIGLLSIIIAIVGFVAVLIQLKQVERGLRSTASGSIYDTASRIKELFIQHPELRPYFTENKPIDVDHEHYELAVVVADFYCLYFEQIATMGENFSPLTRKTWNRYVSDLYARSPIIKAHLSENRDWYTKELWDIVEPNPA